MKLSELPVGFFYEPDKDVMGHISDEGIVFFFTDKFSKCTPLEWLRLWDGLPVHIPFDRIHELAQTIAEEAEDD